MCNCNCNCNCNCCCNCNCNCCCNCQNRKYEPTENEIGTQIGYIKDQLYNDSFYSYIPMFVKKYVDNVNEKELNHISLEDIQIKYMNLIKTLNNRLKCLDIKYLNVQIAIELARYNFNLSNQITNVTSLQPTRYFVRKGHEDDEIKLYKRSLF